MMKLVGLSCVFFVVLLVQYSESRPNQVLPPREGYVPVYIRVGDTPLEHINPSLAQAFHEPLPARKIVSDYEQMLGDQPEGHKVSEELEEDISASEEEHDEKKDKAIIKPSVDAKKVEEEPLTIRERRDVLDDKENTSESKETNNDDNNNDKEKDDEKEEEEEEDEE